MAGYDGRGARFDVVAVEGSDLSFTVTAVDSDAVAVDLSAATITATVYDTSGTALDALTDSVGGAGSNVITLSLSDAEVDALVSPTSWALVVTRGGDDRTWLAGRFTVSAPSRARTGASGTAVVATVDTDVVVTADVLTSAGGVSTLGGLSDVTITTPVSGNALSYNGSAWVNATPAGGGDLLAANNLSELTATAATARTNLGLGSAAVAATGDFATAAQGGLADSATQPGDLATVATTGAYSDLSSLPTLGTAAAAATGDFEAAGAVATHTGDTVDAHDASAISIADVATIYTATDVEGALAEVKGIADAAVTPAEAALAYQPLASVLTNTTASYTTAEASKLAGIEAAADVTDTTNVTAAGALMDSEVDASIKTLALPDNTTISTFGATLVADADAATARSTIGADITSASTVANLTNVPATTQTGTTYTLAAADAHSMIVLSNAAEVTVTIPLFASVEFADGDRIVLLSTGAGGVTLSVTSITLLGSSPNLTIAQNEAIYLECVDASADTWAAIGGTAA